MRAGIIILIFAIIGGLSCRKFVWDKPTDTTQPNNDPENLKNGLVAYYPFNGNANDESANGNNGKVNGATLTTDRFGNSNKAYNFDGVNDYIVSNSTISSLNFVSISGYAYCSNNMGGAFVHIGQDDNMACDGIGIGRGASSSKGNNYLNINNGIKLMGLVSCVGYYNYNSEVTIADKEWFHFVLVKRENMFDYYINGFKISESQIGVVNKPTSKLFIGTTGNLFTGFSNTFINGKLDDIRIYNRALTQEEITYLANN